MATTDTILYASQNNGFKAGVSIAEIGALVGGSTVPDATTTVSGIVKQAANQADSTASDVAGIVADFNSLLAALQAAGLMAAS
jgi:hypothetical protein